MQPDHMYVCLEVSHCIVISPFHFQTLIKRHGIHKAKACRSANVCPAGPAPHMQCTSTNIYTGCKVVHVSDGRMELP